MIHKKWMLRGIVKKFIPIVVLCLFAFLVIGCTSTGSPWEVVRKANTNIARLNELKIGMTKSEVLDLMGTPDKSESFESEGVVVEILFYLTSLSYSPNIGWQNIDSTPLVFERDTLKGWGKNYYEQRLGNPRTPKRPNIGQ